MLENKDKILFKHTLETYSIAVGKSIRKFRKLDEVIFYLTKNVMQILRMRMALKQNRKLMKSQCC